MKYLILSLLAVTALFAAQSKQTFTGAITDEACRRADHSRMRLGPTDAACSIACVMELSGEFVLFDGREEVYALSNQEAAEKLAGQKVTVVGTLDAKTKTIQVDSITAAN